MFPLQTAVGPSSILKYAALLSLLTTFNIASGAGDEVIAPETDALALVKRAIDSGAFGSLEAQESEVPVLIQVDGQSATKSMMAFLVEPGMPVEISVTAVKKGDLAQPTTTGFEPGGIFRQTGYHEVYWEAEPDDIIKSLSDNTISWHSGTTRGRASYLTASVAQLQIVRGAELTASPDNPAPAQLLHGKGGVLLVSGVAFDRNGDGLVDGQNIGIYPNENAEDAPQSVLDRKNLYKPPMTLYRIDDRTRDARITPAMTLGELMPPVFLQEEPAPYYVAVSPRLVEFLRAFEAELSANGLNPEHLEVLRGFVSPTDRRRLERMGVGLAEFTRFQYGDAVALVYTANDDHKIDDINGDANGDVGDIDTLADLAKTTMDKIDKFGAVGVVKSYEGPNPDTETPYLHVDLRGWYTRFRE